MMKDHLFFGNFMNICKSGSCLQSNLFAQNDNILKYFRRPTLEIHICLGQSTPFPFFDCLLYQSQVFHISPMPADLASFLSVLIRFRFDTD